MFEMILLGVIGIVLMSHDTKEGGIFYRYVTALICAYFRHKRNVTLSVQIGFFRHSVFGGHSHTLKNRRNFPQVCTIFLVHFSVTSDFVFRCDWNHAHES